MKKYITHQKDENFVALKCDCDCSTIVVHRYESDYFDDGEIRTDYEITFESDYYYDLRMRNNIFARFKRAFQVLFQRRIIRAAVSAKPEEMKEFIESLEEMINE